MKNMRKKKISREGSSPETWDHRELGADARFVRRASSDSDKRLDDNLGLQTISIRLQKSLIDDLKDLADADGIGYQPYIRQVLTRHVRGEKSKNGKHIRTVK